MRYLYAILFILIFGNVKCQEKIPDGCYRNKLGHVFEFYSDTLEFIGVFGHTLTKGKGRYLISSDTLIFYSETDSTNFYEIETEFNLTISQDSIFIKLLEKEKHEPLSADIISKHLSNKIHIYPNGEINIPRNILPFYIKLSGCSSIPVYENTLIGKNQLILKINTSNCDSVITGTRKYELFIKNDTLVIDDDLFIIDKSCCKIMVIE